MVSDYATTAVSRQTPRLLLIPSRSIRSTGAAHASVSISDRRDPPGHPSRKGGQIQGFLGLPAIRLSGYNLARMRFEILLAPEAGEDLGNLKAHVRAEVRDSIEKHLRHERGKESRSRMKRLSGLSQPQYRLRVGEIRVFYDVLRAQVPVLAIVSKEEATKWLAEAGKRE